MKTERLEMRVQPELVVAVDEWRRRQQVIPSRNEALIRLVIRGLASSIGLSPAAANEADLSSLSFKPDDGGVRPRPQSGS
jgi:hypothetical protein